MAKGKQITDESIVIALLESGKVTAAAAAIGCNPCTIYDRMKEPEFIRLYKRAKTESVRYAVGRLSNALDIAFSTLENVMQDETAPPKDRVTAANSVIQAHCKYITALNGLDEIADDAEKNSFADDFSAAFRM